ncbi:MULTISPECIES: hypothetical protein [unclassified Variovorax]|uniref:hypothetical protein n=1 Tax=unclassified Variovorax TaxID=663243 RepID=UPI00076D1B0B|nr:MULTISPECIES: hypothetical protein [unclassified Variovorax]KWT89330.1 hypothetical protein APY03_3409 [Variovorax sp. WDL1]PNG56506.1 hypothetical protein CHC07_02923 [Variovorax sp. B4]PNG57930.1 hypothetical protein CHC06_02926 [Variovorax sp. B2]VTV09607.1 hypothetical protein WDL1CHR_00700 [Variovorax sp. WDL1]
MTSITYTPRAGSVAYRVIDFLLRNPGEYLTRADIAFKFECSGSSLEMLLGDAMRSSLLERGRNEDGEAIWKLGARRIVLERTEVAPAAPVVVLPQGVAVDPLAIKVRKGVRLKTPEEQLEEKFDALFGSFEVGDSAEFDESWHAAMLVHLKRFRRGQKGVKFVFMPTEPGKIGMERRA